VHRWRAWMLFFSLFCARSPSTIFLASWANNQLSFFWEKKTGQILGVYQEAYESPPNPLANAEICRYLLGRLVPRNSGKGEIFDSFEGPRKSWWGIKQRHA
jgi:hypothetical protein